MAKTILLKATTYLVGTGLNSAIPFFLLPIFTRYLAPSDMGRVAIYQSTLSILLILVAIYIPASASARYFREGKNALAEYVGTGVLLATSLTIALAALLKILEAPIILYTSLGYWTILLALLAAYLQLYINIKLKLMQMQGKAFSFSVLQNLNTLCVMAVSIFFVVFLLYGWQGRVWGQFVATLATALVAIFLMKRHGDIRLCWRKDYAEEIVKFGAPLIPHGVGTVAAIFFNRVILNKMATLDEVGYYMVAAQLTSIITICASALNQAYAPWLYKQLSNAHLSDLDRLKIVKGTYFQFSAMLISAGFFSVLSPWFVNFFLGESYLGAVKYIPWLAISCAFHGMYFMVTNYLFFHKKTGRLATLSASLAILTVLVTPLFIMVFGVVGAAKATAISNALLFFVTWYLASQAEPMPWSKMFRY